MANDLTSARPARVLIVDDHELAREGLRSLLSRADGFEVVAEAADGDQAIRLCERLRPELVLMDVRMPDVDGLSATATILRRSPTTRVVIVTMLESKEYLFKALRAGAAGYLLKGARKDEVLDTLREVLRGEFVVQPALATRTLQDLAGRTPDADGTAHVHDLSEREREVLRLLAQGRTNPDIARLLNVSINTIKVHVVHVLAKLGVSDRTQAAVRAVELGLLERGP